MKLSIMPIFSIFLVLFSGCSGPVIESSQGPHNVLADMKPSEAGAVGYFLPKSIINIKYNQKDKNFDISTKQVPDNNYFYTFRYIPNIFATDEVTVTLTKNGLLSSVKITAEDKWVEIIRNLVSIPSEAAKGLTMPAPSSFEKLKLIDIDIDPDIFIYNKPEKQSIIDDLRNNLNITIDITRHDYKNNFNLSKEIVSQKGVYYRPLMPYDMLIRYEPKKITNDDFPFENKVTLLLPNGAPILCLDITRGAFITKMIDVTFSEGILKEVKTDKPSEILAALDIPLDVVRAFVKLPTDLIQIKIGYTKAETELLKQQAATIKAMRYLLQTEKKFSDPGYPGY